MAVKPYEAKDKKADHLAIRKAAKAGKKTFMLNGVEMKLRKSTVHRVVVTGGGLNKDYPRTSKNLTEHWLHAQPVNGMMPVFCIEAEPGKNGAYASK